MSQHYTNWPQPPAAADRRTWHSGWLKQLLRIGIGDLEAELIFHGHYHFDMIQRVQTEIVNKMRFQAQLFRVDFVVELQHQQHSFFDQLQGEGFLGAIASGALQLPTSDLLKV